jgi:phospholipase C
MDRRTFLKKTSQAAAAGSLFGPASQLEGSSGQIKHIVVLMMENRSFDHLLGWLPNSTGQQAGLSYLDKSGKAQSTYPLAPDWTGCSHPDPDHSYNGARLEVDGGTMKGFLQPTSNDLYAIGYYREQDFPFLSQFARNFTVCDHYFPSVLGPTFPNRIFQLCGQTDRLDDSISLCNLPTIFDHLKAANVSAKYYFNNIPFIALFGFRYLDLVAGYGQFLADCISGNLPAVSFLDPSLTLLLNLGNDNHPHSDMRNGDAFLAQTFHAIANSPAWANTVFVMNYDEWGGFFDTVAPPRALAPNNVDPDLVNGKALLGCRVPCIIASPWTYGNPLRPSVVSNVFDHTSVLQMIESVFNVPPMAAREVSGDVGNLLSAIDLSRPPRSAPSLPSPSSVFPQNLCLDSINPGATSQISSAARMRPAFRDEDHNSFQRMVDSGLMDGWPVNL